MASVGPSDTESNVSGFVRYNDKSFKQLYASIIQKMTYINQDISEININFNNILEQAGPLESRLTSLLEALPKHNLSVAMETD